jgi:hypothetical protein
MTTAHAGSWRRERTVQQPTSNVEGGRGAVAAEVLWSTQPFAHRARLFEPEAVGWP